MKVSQRSIVVTAYSAMALGLCAVYAPWLVVLFAVVAAAPFAYLWGTWKRDLAKRRKERFWT